jgi:hypothetical protein
MFSKDLGLDANTSVKPFLGWVNLADPMLVLHPEGNTHKDLW